MKILEKLGEVHSLDAGTPVEKVLNHKLMPEFRELAHLQTGRQLIQSEKFKSLQGALNDLIYGYEYGCYADNISTVQRRPFIRAVLWHLENGINYHGILETLRNRALVRQADIYFFPAADIGRVRSGNRNVIRDLAIELGYNYFFATSYLNLTCKNLAESPGEDSLGLEGNAIMTRFPMCNLRYIPLKQINDPYHGENKRLGCEKALCVDLIIEKNTRLTTICLNMPEFSSPHQRYRHVKRLFEGMGKETLKNRPCLLAGDFKTSTYNCKSDFHFLSSVLNKMYRDLDFIIREHHNFPERFFEKRLFDYLKHHGFDFAGLNEIGRGCFHALPIDIMVSEFKGNPGKIRQFTRRLLKNRTEKLPFKYDWFAANSFVKSSVSHQSERPKVISHLFHDGKPVSSHDPVLLDFEVGG